MQKIVITPENKDRMIQRVHAFLVSLPSGNWQVTVSKYVKSRTDQQNAALFGVAYPLLCESIGCTPDELHEMMCMRFFGTREVHVSDQIAVYPVRTTTRNELGKRDVLDTKRFSEFYAMVQRVGADCAVFIPDPDPLHFYTKESA